MTEYTVTHTVIQTVEADTPEQAEVIARRVIENSAELWWPAVLEGADVEVSQ